MPTILRTNYDFVLVLASYVLLGIIGVMFPPAAVLSLGQVLLVEGLRLWTPSWHYRAGAAVAGLVLHASIAVSLYSSHDPEGLWAVLYLMLLFPVFLVSGVLALSLRKKTFQSLALLQSGFLSVLCSGGVVACVIYLWMFSIGK